MKSRLNLTIEKELLMKIKRYARSRKISVSQLVEHYFTALTKTSGRKNLVDLVESLPKRPVPKGDLKKLYYEQRRTKYGF